MLLFLDILILFRSGTCFMTVIEHGRGHGTVQSSAYQQKSHGCKYVENRQTMQKKNLVVEHCCGNKGRSLSSVISEIIKILHKYVGSNNIW